MKKGKQIWLDALFGGPQGPHHAVLLVRLALLFGGWLLALLGLHEHEQALSDLSCNLLPPLLN